MQNKRIAVAAAAALAGLVGLAGCSSAPKLADPLAMPAVPAERSETVTVDLTLKSNNRLHDNVVQMPGHAVRPGSTVVINVPESLMEMRSRQGAANQEFKTKDFFNEAEQQIEKVFIGSGFRVLSRARFEAKLRDLRDEARCDLNTYSCLRSSVADEARPILDDLKRRFDRGEITAAQYSDQIAEFKSKMQTRSAGRSRSGDNKELTDISEVIRAAQAGDIRADYILQINRFHTDKPVQLKADLRHEPQVRDFLAKYPQLRPTFESGHHELTCAIVGAELNAKLIHVQTGEIVWIGSHEMNEISAQVERIAVELRQRTFVSNAQEVQQFVAHQNTPYQRQARYGRAVSLPQWKYQMALVPPTVSAGRCEKTFKLNDETSATLARRVANELISTIKVASR
jgi:hypothetical protein